MASWTLIALFVGAVGLSALAGALVTLLALRFFPEKWGVTKKSATLSVDKESPSQPSVPGPLQSRPTRVQEESPILSVQHRADSELSVYVRGEPYGRLEEIADAQVGCDALEAIKVVLQFAERWLASTQRSLKQATPKESTLTAEKFLEDLKQHTGFVTSRASASTTVDRVLLAEQIDEFVQKRLKELPDLDSLRVKLGSSANGALSIRVGSDTYDSIDAIPYAEVREIIQKAIHDWESE